MSEAEKTISIREQIDALRKDKEARDKVLEEKMDQIELLDLQLEEKFTKELGARGEEFEIVPTIYGVFAFRKPDELTFRKAQLKIGDGKKEDRAIAIHHLLASCLLHPSAVDFGRIMGERPGIGSAQLLPAVAKLAGSGEEVRRSKS